MILIVWFHRHKSNRGNFLQIIKEKTLIWSVFMFLTNLETFEKAIIL